MEQKYSFVGNYKTKGTYLVGNNLKLLITKRKHVTPTKSTFFILDKTTSSGTYISSLYSITDNQYKFDYKGVNYIITYLGTETAQINLID